jgi:hypothetical protein
MAVAALSPKERPQDLTYRACLGRGRRAIGVASTGSAGE